jgi:hypothetical protein
VQPVSDGPAVRLRQAEEERQVVQTSALPACYGTLGLSYRPARWPFLILWNRFRCLHRRAVLELAGGERSARLEEVIRAYLDARIDMRDWQQRQRERQDECRRWRSRGSRRRG